jgi:hypothetical protein
MGHVPSKIPQISAIFKIISPPLATSHGGGALVDMVVGGAEVPGSNPRASPPTAYVMWYILIYDMAYSLWLNFAM